MQQVLQTLLENKLFNKACEFLSASVTFWGFVIASGQARADPEKIRVVEEWQTPVSHKQLLGFANFYQHFI